ncbi:MAG: transglycosylase SLT domain-containing protein [Xanthomonadales bacterium]|nr:transglycosylase SLT domain-containing protein [Xanthomonadales bacterium]
MRLLFQIILLCIAGLAQAGTLYRCEGNDGETVYSSERSGYRNCRSVATYEARNSPPSAADTASTDKPHVEFRTAPAGSSPVAPPKSSGARVTRGAVYRYEKDGITHYTNKAPGRDAGAKLLFSYIETCYACGEAPGIDWNKVPLNTTAFAGEVSTAAQMAGVDPALVRAIMHAESAFRPNAVSHVGAQGLMQLMPDTATRFGVKDAFVPSENIAGGSQYLAWLVDRYDGDISQVAAAYNAGEGAVDRHDGVPPYQETQRFVERVGILYERYREALRGTATTASAVASGADSSGASR